MFCVNCGNNNAGDMKFCTRCGAPLAMASAAAPPVTAPYPHQTPAFYSPQTPAPYPHPVPTPNTSPAYSPAAKAKSGSNVARMVFLIIAGIGLLAFGIYGLTGSFRVIVQYSVNGYWSMLEPIVIFNLFFRLLTNMLMILTGVAAFIAIKVSVFKIPLIIAAIVITLSIMYSLASLFLSVPFDYIVTYLLFNPILIYVFDITLLVLLLVGALLTRKKPR